MGYKLRQKQNMFERTNSGRATFLGKPLNFYKYINVYVLKDFISINKNKTDIIIPKGTILNVSFPNGDLYLGERGDSSYFENQIYLSENQLNAFTTYFTYAIHTYEEYGKIHKYSPIIIKQEILNRKSFKFSSKDLSFEKFELYFDKVYCPLLNMFYFCEPVVVNSFMPGILDSLNNLKQLEQTCSIDDFDEALESINDFLEKTLNIMFNIGTKELPAILTPKEILDKKTKEEQIKNTEALNNSKKKLDNFIEELQRRKDLLDAFNDK